MVRAKTALKPCPFCGGSGKLHNRKGKYYVECNGDCWAQTKKYTDFYIAIGEWNNMEQEAESES